MSKEAESMTNGRGREPEREMDGEEAIMAGMVAGLCGAPAATETALAGRLARLEEHFARLCTVVGRLEQELAGLRGTPPAMAVEPAMADRLVARVDPQRCLGCGQCLPSCPNGLLAVCDGLAVVTEPARCDGRGRCLGHCSADALSLGPCRGLNDSA